MAQYGKFYVRIGGAVGDVGETKYGWRTAPYKVEGIADELGILPVKTSDKVVYGANQPKPPRVRIQWGKNENVGGEEVFIVEGSRTIFCDTDKLGQVLNGSLRGKTMKVKRGTQTLDKVIGEVSLVK